MRRTACCLVVFASVWAVALAGAALDLPRLEKELAAAAKFNYGGDAAPPRYIEGVVVAVAKDPQARAQVEERLVRALRGKATRDAREFFCRQLFTIGTSRCVPALEALLTDPALSHIARYALEGIEDPAACEALHRALGKVSGRLKVGVINTLARRRYAKALPDLVALISSQDEAVAAAAIAAIGSIGGGEALKALEQARARAGEPRRIWLDHAILACADALLGEGKTEEAARIYQRFYYSASARHFKLAGLRGLARAQPEKALPLLTSAIKGQAPQLRASAIALADEAKGAEVTRALVALIPTVPPETQEVLVRALGRRGDPEARTAMLAALESEHEAVRVAALEALGTIGDASLVPLLAARAAAARGNEQRVARASLARLGGGDVVAAIIKCSRRGEAKVRVECIRALATRRATTAAGPLLELARDADESVRREALRALGAIASEKELPALLALVLEPKDPRDRPAAEQAVVSVFRRAGDREKETAVLLEAMRGASPGARAYLIRLLGRAATARALAAVRGAIGDRNEMVRDAAIRALASWPTAEPADDLLRLAQTATNQAHKVIALRGYVRVAATTPNPTAMYVKAIEVAKRPEDKRLVLAGLGSAGSPQALEVVEKYLEDRQLQSEAAMAMVQIADVLRRSDAKRATAVLKRILATVKNPAVQKRAQDVLNEIERYEGYILAWLGSGPYRTKGKDGHAIFNVSYPPEDPQAKGVKWRKVTRGIGAWDINLEAEFGALDDCACYLRTRVFSPIDQDAQLELGSDDAIKVWLNGKLVHANNADRGLAPRQDIVKVRLKKGWNDLMLEVIEHRGGWAVCCRIRKPGGAALEGLKYEAK